MRKHGAVLDMRNDQLSFWPGHYQHDVALKPRVAEPQAEYQEEQQHTKPCAKEPRAGRSMTILKQLLMNESPELLPYLLPSTQGVSKVAKTPEAVKPKKKKKLSTIPQKPKPNAKGEAKVENKKPRVEQADENDKPLDLAFIGGAPFMHLAKKKAEIFAISMRDVKYQLNKGTKPLTDPKTVVPVDYHDYLDVFSKEASDTLSPHTKFDHKIELLKDAGELGHSALQGMSTPQLKFVKKFLEEHLKKGFIEASSAPCSSSILLAKKPGGGICYGSVWSEDEV